MFPTSKVLTKWSAKESLLHVERLNLKRKGVEEGDVSGPFGVVGGEIVSGPVNIVGHLDDRPQCDDDGFLPASSLERGLDYPALWCVGCVG